MLFSCLWWCLSGFTLRFWFDLKFQSVCFYWMPIFYFILAVFIDILYLAVNSMHIWSEKKWYFPTMKIIVTFQGWRIRFFSQLPFFWGEREREREEAIFLSDMFTNVAILSYMYIRHVKSNKGRHTLGHIPSLYVVDTSPTSTVRSVLQSPSKHFLIDILNCVFKK